jgi:hypothetical protein
LEAHFQQKVQPHEKFSSANNSAAACAKLFEPRKMSKKKTSDTNSKKSYPPPTAEDFCNEVVRQMSNAEFCLEHQRKESPLPMLALAAYVVERIINNNDKDLFRKYFDGITLTVPPSNNMHKSPHYHSIVGQKLLQYPGLTLRDSIPDGTRATARRLIHEFL